MRKKYAIHSDNDHYMDVRITTNGDDTFFEIGDYITNNVPEAVSMMMRIKNIPKSLWSKKVNIDFNHINTRMALYWLTGGDVEWTTLKNYKNSWCVLDMDFDDEFGQSIRNILSESITLGDIRDGFIKHLNLPILYEFALSRDFIRKEIETYQEI